MNLSTFQTPFPQDKVPIITKNGTIVRPAGYNFFVSLWNRTGGSTGVIPSLGIGLVATGASQLTALSLENDWNQVTGGGGSGVQIPSLQPGQTIVILNISGSAINVYPIVGSIIDALAANAAYSLANNKQQIFEQWDLTHLRSTQLG